MQTPVHTESVYLSPLSQTIPVPVAARPRLPIPESDAFLSILLAELLSVASASKASRLGE